MAERSSVLQGFQLGVEATPGTGVPANRRLQATSLKLQPAGNVNKFMPQGYKYPTLLPQGKEWVEGKLDGWASYQDLAYLLSGLVAYAAPVQNGATAAYTQTFAPSTTAEDTVKTYTFEEGGAVRAHSAAFGMINELELKGDREKVEVSGSVIARALTDGITLTASPTEIVGVPIEGDQVQITADGTSGGLGTTVLTRVLEWSWKYGGKFLPVWAVNSANTSFVDKVEAAPPAMLNLTLEGDATGMGYLSTLRAGDTKFVRIKAVGALIASTFYYTLQIDMAVKVSEVLKLEDKDGVYATKVSLHAVHDAGWAKALTIALTNTIVSL